MQRSLNTIVGLIVYLAIFYNLGRIIVGDQSLVDIHGFVYILATIAVISIIIIPLLRNQDAPILLVSWGLIYVLCKIFIFRDPPLLGGRFTYLSATELTLVLISVFLANLFAQNMARLERLIESTLFPKLDRRIYSMDTAGKIIEYEFIRGRRYNHPISAMVVEPDPGSSEWPEAADLDQVVRDFKKRYLIAKLAKEVSKQVRLTDLVVETDGEGRFIIVCPETNSDNSVLFAKRLQTAVKENLGVSLAYGIATFPEDARTFEAILNKAESKLSGVLSSSTPYLDSGKSAV
jgi:hypothetical protein